MANRDNGSSAGCIEVALTACGEDKTSLAAHSLRIRLQEISRKNGVTHCCFSIETVLARFCTILPAVGYFIERPMCNYGLLNGETCRAYS